MFTFIKNLPRFLSPSRSVSDTWGGHSLHAYGGGGPTYVVRVPIQSLPLMYIFCKRLLDLFLAVCALIALAPVMILIALAIKATTNGPIIYSQIRVWAGGRLFTMYKFRSMMVDAELRQKDLVSENVHKDGPIFKIKRDPRITPVGRFIRRYSLDELPQLFNVVMYDMSIVGPRPAIPTEVTKYESWQLTRLSVKPGLTCIWQVSGRSNISFDQWMRMDIEYIEKSCLWLDICLIVRTFKAVFLADGAF